MRLAAQERRREGNEPQKTKVAHHAAYPWHEVFEVEIKDEDAAPVGTSSERLEAVEFGVVPAVSRLQPSDVGLDDVGGAAGGVPGAEGMEVEVMEDTVVKTELMRDARLFWVTEEMPGADYVIKSSWYVGVYLHYSHGKLICVGVGLDFERARKVNVPAGWQPTDDACKALAKAFVEKRKKEGRA